MDSPVGIESRAATRLGIGVDVIRGGSLYECKDRADNVRTSM